MADSILEILIRAKNEAAPVIEQAVKGLKDHQETFKKTGDTMLLGAAAMAGGLGLLARQSEEANMATLRLNAAIQGSGKAIDAGKITRYADELQRLTGIDADATTNAAALLTTFQLTEDQIIALLPRIQNLSVMFGMDLDQAATMVGKSMDGSVMALRRVGITIDEDRYKHEGFNYLLKAIDKNTGQAATAMGETFTGALKRAGNTMGDVGEAIGGALVPELVGLVDNVTELAQLLKDHPGWTEFIAKAGLMTTGTLALGGAFFKIVSMVPDFVSGWSKMQTALSALGGVGLGPIGLVLAGMAALAVAVQTLQAAQEAADRERQAAIERTKEEADEVRELVAEYQALSGKAEKTAEDKDRLAAISAKLAEILPGVTTATDAEGRSLVDLGSALDGVNEKYRVNLRLREQGIERAIQQTRAEMQLLEVSLRQMEGRGVDPRAIQSSRAQIAEAKQELSTLEASLQGLRLEAAAIDAGAVSTGTRVVREAAETNKTLSEEQAKKLEELRKQKLQDALEWIEQEKVFGHMSEQAELDAYNRILAGYELKTAERTDVKKRANEVEKRITEEAAAAELKAITDAEHAAGLARRQNVADREKIARDAAAEQAEIEQECQNTISGIDFQEAEKRAAWFRRNSVEAREQIADDAEKAAKAEAKAAEDGAVEAIRARERVTGATRRNTQEQVRLVQAAAKAQAEAERRAWQQVENDTAEAFVKMGRGQANFGSVVSAGWNTVRDQAFRAVGDMVAKFLWGEEAKKLAVAGTNLVIKAAAGLLAWLSSVNLQGVIANIGAAMIAIFSAIGSALAALWANPLTWVLAGAVAIALNNARNDWDRSRAQAEAQAANVPALETGGPILQTGLALVHQGEYVLPRPVVDWMAGVGGGGAGNVYVTVSGNHISSPADENRLAEKIGRAVIRRLEMQRRR